MIKFIFTVLIHADAYQYIQGPFGLNNFIERNNFDLTI